MSAPSKADITIDLLSRQMRVFDTVVRLAYREDPGMVLCVVDRTQVWRLEVLFSTAGTCLAYSAILLMVATAWAWWIGLACLPLSLAGASSTRRWRNGPR